MGNVLDVVKEEGDANEEDIQYLSTQNSAIFNEGYLEEIFDSLPEFEGTLIPEVSTSKVHICIFVYMCMIGPYDGR